MKILIFFITMGILPQAYAQQGPGCSEKRLNCEIFEFQWKLGESFVVTKKLEAAEVESDKLAEDVCAVRHFCKDITIAPDELSMIFPEKLQMPEGIPDTPENQEQLKNDCSTVIPSQLSNACYEEDIWGTGGYKYTD